jgi:twitching motility two-component system response regulator PilG
MQRAVTVHQTTKPWCRIFHLGLGAREILVIESMFRANPELESRYVFGPPTDSDPVDVLFVNGDDEAAVAAWQQQRQQRPELAAIVAVSGDAAFEHARVIRKPFDFRNFVDILDAITSTDASPEAQEGAADALQVLVVDDSFPARQYMKLKLEEISAKAGIALQIDLADSGERALEVAQGHAYDIAFLDVVMPGMDGYSLCERLKALYSMRVAMLTGRASSVDYSRGRSAGCDNYLPKPANESDLRSILQLTALKKTVQSGRGATPAQRPAQ